MKLLLIIIGIVLIAVGLVSLAYQGITYTSRETVVDLGPIKATADKQKTIPLPPILGGIGLAGGVALLLGTWRRRGGAAPDSASKTGCTDDRGEHRALDRGRSAASLSTLSMRYRHE